MKNKTKTRKIYSQFKPKLIVGFVVLGISMQLLVFLSVFNVLPENNYNLFSTGHDSLILKEENGEGSPQFIRDLVTRLLQKEENGGGSPQFIRDLISKLLQKEENGGGSPQFIRDLVSRLLQKEENGGGSPQFIRDLVSDLK